MHPIYEAIQKTSLFKKILSYLFPIKITSFSSFDDKNLFILLERGQFTLSTSDAYYSDGKRYQPFISVRQYLSAKHNIDAMHEVLILGTGLASAVLMMEEVANKNLHYDLVEIDDNVLQGAAAVLDLNGITNYTPHSLSAQQFLATSQKQYDFINIDIFSGRIVPQEICSTLFQEQVKQHLKEGGIMSFNYIETSAEQTSRIEALLHDLYKTVHITSLYYNKIFIVTK